jgi:hypothetical protein
MGSMEAPRVLEALIVRPGDTLIIRLDSCMADDEADHFKTSIRQQLDPSIKVLLIEAPGGQILMAKSA